MLLPDTGTLLLTRFVSSLIVFLGILAISVFSSLYLIRKNADSITNRIIVILFTSMFIGVILTLFKSDFISGIGIEVVGAYLTGTAFVVIERLFNALDRETKNQSSIEKMCLSKLKVRQKRLLLRKDRKYKI